MTQAFYVVRGQRGLSLVEMMMVLVVFGIVVAAAVPNVGFFMQRNSARGQAEKFKMQCMQAQQQAQRTRQSHRIVYDPTDRHYFTERWDHATSTWVLASPDTTWLEGSVDMDGGTTTDPTNHVITFEPLGTIATSDCPADVYFASDAYDSTSISIVRTGRMIVRHH